MRNNMYMSGSSRIMCRKERSVWCDSVSIGGLKATKPCRVDIGSICGIPISITGNITVYTSGAAVLDIPMEVLDWVTGGCIEELPVEYQGDVSLSLAQIVVDVLFSYI